MRRESRAPCAVRRAPLPNRHCPSRPARPLRGPNGSGASRGSAARRRVPSSSRPSFSFSFPFDSGAVFRRAASTSFRPLPVPPGRAGWLHAAAPARHRARHPRGTARGRRTCRVSARARAARGSIRAVLRERLTEPLPPGTSWPAGVCRLHVVGSGGAVCAWGCLPAQPRNGKHPVCLEFTVARMGSRWCRLWEHAPPSSAHGVHNRSDVGNGC